MTRKEYLSQKTASTKLKDARLDLTEQIEDIPTYLRLKKLIEDFESSQQDFSFDDYAAFDKSYEALVENLNDKMDEDGDKSMVEEIVEFMNDTDWRWVGEEVTVDRFNENIKYLYELCVASGCPEYEAAGGGITIHTSLYNHTVGFRFDDHQVIISEGHEYFD
jgi:hypothetical protein